jgi:integrase
MIQQFLKSVERENARATHQNYKRYLSTFDQFMKKKEETKFSRKVVNDFITHLGDWGIGKPTIYLHLVAIKAFYSWLVAQEVIKENPLIGNPRKVRYISSRNKPVFTDAEYVKLKQQAETFMHQYWLGAIIAGWNTGLRLSDVSLLEWSEIKFASESIRLKPQKTSRFEREVEIPMANELRDWLAKQASVTGTDRYVQPAMAVQYKFDESKTLSAQFSRLARFAGIIGKGFHTLRHAFCTRNLAAGVNPAILATMTGQSLKIIMTYCHPTLEQKREQMKGLLA